jgi:hypothetical protein
MLSHLYFTYLEPFFRMVQIIPKNRIYEMTRYSFDPLNAVMHNGNEWINLSRRNEQMELTNALVEGRQLPNDDDVLFR